MLLVSELNQGTSSCEKALTIAGASFYQINSRCCKVTALAGEIFVAK